MTNEEPTGRVSPVQTDVSPFADIEDPLVREIAEAVATPDTERVASLTRQALDEGKLPLDICQRGLTVGLRVVASRFERGEAVLPELAMAAASVKTGIDLVDLPESEIPIAPADGERYFAKGAESHPDVDREVVSDVLEANGVQLFADTHIQIPERSPGASPDDSPRPA